MAKTTRNSALNGRQHNLPSRPTITLELVRAHAPNATSAEKLASTFGLDPVDYDGIRDATRENIVLAAETLQDILNETAMAIHLQRVVGSFVSSAYGAAQFYGTRITLARELTSKLANDDRDEDREAVYGFESRAARFREFAAEAGLTAYALMAAAEGATEAHLRVTGEEWKPFEPPAVGPATLGRQTADVELAAFA
jgi:hypothetical protein